jgi:protein phosphatase
MTNSPRRIGIVSLAAGRQFNEDSAGSSFDPNTGNQIVVVADGMGGHGGGDIASKALVTSLIDSFLESCKQNVPLDFDEAFRQAQYKIESLSMSGVGTKTMGTTAVVAYLTKATLTIGHVGDSRAILFDKLSAVRLTADHLKAVSSTVSDVQAKKSPQGNVLSKAISANSIFAPDILSIPIPAAGCLVLCTDGVSEAVDEQQMFSEIRGKSPEKDANNIVQKAITNKTSDNATTAVIYFKRK